MGFGADEFISFLPPPGAHVKDYNRSIPPASQPKTIPPLFLDAMAVRETVFVHEQGVALDREQDDDDGRSYHWVAYASVARRSSQGGGNGTDGQGEEPQGRRESDHSAAVKVPAGTVRLIPPFDPALGQSAQIAPHLTEFENEPYVLLGRLAVSPAYRRLGLGRLLVNAALKWACDNGKATFKSHLKPAELEAKRLEHPSIEEEIAWKGLVVVHAQQGDAEKIWSRMGFVKDDGMGEWEEEGIMHVGMWRRIP